LYNGVNKNNAAVSLEKDKRPAMVGFARMFVRSERVLGFPLWGLATGIGSLPYLEPAPALDLIKHNLAALPHWPQLPRRAEAEGFVRQFLGALEAQGIVAAGEKPRFLNESEDWPERLTAFYTLYFSACEGDDAAIEAFGSEREYASGFYDFFETAKAGGFPGAAGLKGQVVGPLTVGFQLTDAGGRPAYYDPGLRELIVKNLTMTARWQVGRLQALRSPVLIFIDEPAVSVYGQSTYITVTREQVAADMEAVVAGVKAVGAAVGVHSCAAVDWSILLTLDIDVLSFDAYGYFNSLLPYRRELTAFLEKGGVLAWGIVPTSEAAHEEDAGSLIERLRSYWKELAARGVPEELLRRQWLITPSCGAGTLSEPLAERIYGLTKAAAAKLRQEG
jgi:methionine synthase II (cobalamin-independent)